MHIIENGNVAAALGVKLAGAQVIAAYPITPQTPLTEKLSEFIESGEMDAQYVPVESEHSALAVCIAAINRRQGLHRHQRQRAALYARADPLGSRRQAAPGHVRGEQGCRRAMDHLERPPGFHLAARHRVDTDVCQRPPADHRQRHQGLRLAEEVIIPVMVCYDGYLLSHTYMPFEVPDEEQVARFLPPFKPAYALDPENPANLNTVTLPDVRVDVTGEMAHGYMEIRYLLQEDLRATLTIAQQIEDRFTEVFGRGGDALLEPYRCDDAEYVVVGLGSLTYQLHDVVDTLRGEGHRVGVLGSDSTARSPTRLLLPPCGTRAACSSSRRHCHTATKARSVRI